MSNLFRPELVAKFVYYLSERHRIFQRRQLDQPVSPGKFTDDKILSTYKFTNVMRSNDRTTRWLVNNWYNLNRHQPAEIQALNCAIARYFGRIEFLEDLGYQTSWEPQQILEVAKRRFREKKPVFTGAYIITNQGMKDPKEEIVVNCFLAPYRNALSRLVEIAERTQSWQSVSEGMSGLPGMGPFMTKEILLDWQLTPLLENAKDKLTWTPAGPGAIRGLRRICGATGTEVNRGSTQDTALQLMKDLMYEVSEAQKRGELPADFPVVGVDFGVTDIQFSLCELDKYMRVELGEGRPRSLFKASKLPL
jgi:hypothetical protein